MRFEDFDLLPALLDGVDDLGFEEPTDIQRQAIPPALEGRDVLAAAMTGSGKTAAFALPLLDIVLDVPGRGIKALVLTPTRELAAQVEEQISALGRHTDVTTMTIFGGVSARPQEQALKRGVEIVVATPGRLLDHMGSGLVDFSALEILVLDEADRMLDMGFLPDIKRILAELPDDRQNLLFSATLPKPIVELAKKMLHDPVRLDVEREAAPAEGIEQRILPVAQKLKPALLFEMIQRGGVDTALVFTRTKHRANRLHDYLSKRGVQSERIHGNRSQRQREKALAAFKNGELEILVATDIAARGIDIEELPHVINFDVPGQPEDYIHRVGRTARARATGDALTFAAPEESKQLKAIERAVEGKIPRFHLEGFDYDGSPEGRFEIPVHERIAQHRKKKADDQARARAKAERKDHSGQSGQGGRGRGQQQEQAKSAAGASGGGGGKRRRRRGRGRGGAK